MSEKFDFLIFFIDYLKRNTKKIFLVNINDFLTKNLENQENYNSRFSEILKNMDIFDADDDSKQDDNEQKVDNQNNEDKKNDDQSENQQERTDQEQEQTGVDADYDFSDNKIDEQLVDTDSEKQST